MDFQPVMISKARKLGKIGNVWFSRMGVLLLVLHFAQGKAYETIRYKGMFNSTVVTLNLANGYLGASTLAISGKTFRPEVGIPDHYRQLKFDGSPGYFILDQMQEAYEQPPVFITGKYYLGHQIIAIKFKRL